MGLLDIDICGPSLPKMLGLEGQEIHSSGAGWSPVYLDDNLGVMSIGFMLPNPDDAVIWRGPRKNGLIKQFLKARRSHAPPAPCPSKFMPLLTRLRCAHFLILFLCWTGLYPCQTSGDGGVNDCKLWVRRSCTRAGLGQVSGRLRPRFYFLGLGLGDSGLEPVGGQATSL